MPSKAYYKYIDTREEKLSYSDFVTKGGNPLKYFKYEKVFDYFKNQSNEE